MATFYAIESPSIYGKSSWVRTKDGNKYADMGRVPTLFSEKAYASDVIAQYKVICENSGRTASSMKIVEVNL